MNGLSLVMLVKNEEALLSKVLWSCRDWVDEVVIAVDSLSTDRTETIAREHGATVVKVVLNQDYAQARNAGLAKVTLPWALHLDADELPSRGLMPWIRAFVSVSGGHDVGAVCIARHNLIGGQPAPGREWEWHPRLFRSDLRYVNALHECVDTLYHPVHRTPERHFIQHYKTAERQAAQNEWYRRWEH